jgi:CHAT domain-containing protein
MKHLGFSIILLVIAGLCFQQCAPMEAKEAPQNDNFSLEDYIYRDSLSTLFSEADTAKWQGAYDLSYQLFLQTLDEAGEEEELSMYAYNQLAYNALQLKDTLNGRRWLATIDSIFSNKRDLPKHLLADYYFNQGKFQILSGVHTGTLDLLHQAKSLYDSLYSFPHLKRGQVNEEIANFYQTLSFEDDSIEVYLTKSLQHFNADEKLYPFSLEAQLKMTDQDIINKSYELAQSRINTLVDFLESRPEVDSMFLALTYTQKGKIVRKQRKMEEAYQSLEKAYDIWSNGCQDDPKGIKVLEGLGYFHLFNRPLDSAKIFSIVQELQAYYPNELWSRIHSERISALYHYQKGNDRECIHSNLRVLQFYDGLAFPDQVMVGQAYFQLIDMYRNLQMFDSSEFYLMKEVLFSTSFRNSRPDYQLLLEPEVKNQKLIFINYYQYAKTLLEQYEYDNSREDALKKAFRIYQLNDTLVFNYLAQFQENEAKNLLDLIVELYDESQSIKAAYLLHQKTSDPLYLNWANRFIERTKSSIMYRDVMLHLDDFFPEVPASIRERELKLNQEVRMLESAYECGTRMICYDKKSRSNKLFTDSVRTLYPRYYSERIYQEIPPIKELTAAIQQNRQCILQFYSSEVAEYLLFIHPDTSLLMQLPADPSVDAQLETFRSELRKGIEIDKAAFKEASFRLFERYIQPISRYLENVEELVIIPSQKLELIPFSAFLSSIEEGHQWGKQHFLIQDFSIRYAHSIKNYWRQQAAPFRLPASSDILALAFNEKNTAGASNARASLSALPYSDDEILNIPRHISDANPTLLFGGQSTEANFLSACNRKDFDIIHLALHAESSERDRFDNKLLLPGKRRNTIDTLYGFELPVFKKNPLIVLSSCQTAYGTQQLGEGTYSLTRCFLQSGAAQVIASLWNIEDSVTSELMDDFYEQLSNGHSPSKSLRNAQLRYLEEANDFASNPGWWSLLVSY